MSKSPLFSGWFRVQSFFDYSVIMLLLAPLLLVSGFTHMGQSKAKKNALAEGLSNSVVVSTAGELKFDFIVEAKVTRGLNYSLSSSAALRKIQLQRLEMAENMAIAALRQTSSMQAYAVDFLASQPRPLSSNHTGHYFTSDLLPIFTAPSSQYAKVQDELVQKWLRDYNKKAINLSIASAEGKSLPKAQKMKVVKELNETQLETQEDPIASPHPIPWKWILSIQEAISSKGNSGMFYYRSTPVISPDVRYAVYSRIQLLVEPKMNNTRVTSVLFIEDRQKKTLKVLKSTSKIKEPLLKVNTTTADYIPKGTIEIFVPVSWSKDGCRFLTRQFQGLMNTSDATDSAVIWDKENNSINTIAPSQKEDEHHKMAVLLGWSKAQPTKVMFRAGELGQEEWPLVTVSDNGKTVAAINADRPVVFGDHNQDIWRVSQVASR